MQKEHSFGLKRVLLEGKCILISYKVMLNISFECFSEFDFRLPNFMLEYRQTVIFWHFILLMVQSQFLLFSYSLCFFVRFQFWTFYSLWFWLPRKNIMDKQWYCPKLSSHGKKNQSFRMAYWNQYSKCYILRTLPWKLENQSVTSEIYDIIKECQESCFW